MTNVARHPDPELHGAWTKLTAALCGLNEQFELVTVTAMALRAEGCAEAAIVENGLNTIAAAGAALVAEARQQAEALRGQLGEAAAG